MYAGETRRAPPAERAGARLKIYLLGRFEVVRHDGPIPADAWRRRRPSDLLKLIALAPGRQLAREQVIETLWRDKDSASGANNLHRALYDLRRILGGRWVDLDHGRVFLSDQVWTDVDSFERSAASDDPADRAQAAALYRGDLCPDDPEEAWLEPHRLRLRSTMARVALPAAREAVERGDPTAAMALLRHALSITPHDEEPHALMMRLLASAGRRADALRQYDACETARRARALPAPGAPLRSLRDEIQRGHIGPARPTAPYDGYRRAARRLLGTSEPAPLRGRTSTLLLFESLVERGWGSLVLLGERGVGATRLALEGARIAQQAGAIVLAGTFDADRGTPFSCFSDLFSDYLRTSGAASPDPFAAPADPATPPPDGKARLLEAVRAQLASIGGGRPIYAIVEDLHCADESSANLFHYLARAASTMGLMLVATCREDALHVGTPAQMLLAHLDSGRLARGIRVPRLDLAASRQQLGDIFGTPPSETLALRFYRLTDGSPFYTEELARAFKESGHVQVPEDPVAAVRERVARLGRRAVTLLEAGAVMGRRFELEMVLAATGLTTHDSLVVLDEVLEARIVDHDGVGQRFHHSLVRDAIYEGLAPERRTELHRAIADAIEERAARTPTGITEAAEQLAHHRRAGLQPDRAFAHFVTAGHRARERAGLHEACAFYEAALALGDASGASGPQRLELLEGLGQVQLALAEIPGALRTFESAIALTDANGWRPGPELRARARRQGALASLAAGRCSEARHQIEQGLTDAFLGPGEERSELHHLRGLVDLHEGRLVAVASSAGARGASPEIHLALWENQLLGDRSLSAIEAALATAEPSGAGDETRRAAVVRALEGALAAQAGRFEPAERALRDAQARARAQGCASSEAFALCTLASLLTLRGRVEEGLALLGEAMLVAERAQLRRHALLGVHASLAYNRLAAGALHAAEDAIVEASALTTRHGDCAVCHARFRPALIRVHLARGRVAEAALEAGDLDALATRWGGRRARALAGVARGRVLVAQSRHGEAVAAFLDAAAAWGSLEDAADAAVATVLAARAIRSGAILDRRADADALVERASQVLDPAVIVDA